MIKEIKSFIYFFYDRVFFKKKKIEFKKNKIYFKFIAKDRTSYNWYSNYKKLASSEINLIKTINYKKIKNVLYCGSHQSVLPIILSNLYLKKSFFHCVEAMKYNHKIAKQNINMNGLKKRFELHNVAISDNDETLYFDSLKSNSDNTNNLFFKEKIKAKNISHFFKAIKNLDLIFLDIEGMESKIIPHILNNNLDKIKYIFIELHGDKILSKYNSSNKKIYKMLMNYKFKINILNKKKILNFKNNKIPTNRHYLICSK